MYGDHQEHLRSQAAKYFDGTFQSSFGSIHITGMPKADLTYPEVAAADYLTGYVTDAMHNRLSVADLPDEVGWYDSNWREPKFRALEERAEGEAELPDLNGPFTPDESCRPRSGPISNDA